VIDPRHRYPTHLIEVVQLANGSRVLVRPALPQDCELQRVFVATLSDEARYFRFMTMLSELPEAMAVRFTSIDYRSHMALIATVLTDAGETMIGEARYVVDEGDAAACEFALSVADECQGKGLASTLLDRLIDHAASSGISHMTADTISSNKAMIGLAQRAGFAVTQKLEDRRLVHLAKALLPGDRRSSVSRQSHGDCAVAA
jgi:acetyltransferase